MNSNLRKTIVASAIAALIAVPAWAATDAPKAGSDTPTSSAPGTAGSAQSPAGQREGATPGMSGQSGAATSAAARASTSDNPLYARTADDLEGMDVVNAADEKIGSIDKIVTKSDGSEAHAVISVGGVLGMGARDVLVSLDELKPMGDDKLQISATEDELKARPEYDKEQYVELEGDGLISDSITEFSAFEPRSGTGDAGMKRDRPEAGPGTQNMPTPATPSTRQ